MKPYTFDDFNENDAWIIYRLDTQVQNQPIDIYVVMDLPSGLILGMELVEDYLSAIQADILLKQAKIQKKRIPSRILLVKNDPAETFLSEAAQKQYIHFESVPTIYLEALIAPLKQSFGQQFFSPSSAAYANFDENQNSSDQESAKYMVPDSYDPCPCASGKKYKFCCKKIFREVVEAMVAAEDGKISEALNWISKAKEMIGETAEIVCREAIIYSYVDTKKCEELLDKCLTINPHHPRAYYIRALMLAERGDLDGAIKFYEMAIAYYPPSDQYHLNEAYNNLGIVFHKKGDSLRAKIAWEKALLFMPSDEIARRNLNNFYKNLTPTANE